MRQCINTREIIVRTSEVVLPRSHWVRRPHPSPRSTAHCSAAAHSVREHHPLRKLPWNKKIRIIGIAVGALMAVSFGIYGIVLCMFNHQVRAAAPLALELPSPPNTSSHSIYLFLSLVCALARAPIHHAAACRRLKFARSTRRRRQWASRHDR